MQYKAVFIHAFKLISSHFTNQGLKNGMNSLNLVYFYELSHCWVHFFTILNLKQAINPLLTIKYDLFHLLELKLNNSFNTRRFLRPHLMKNVWFYAFDLFFTQMLTILTLNTSLQNRHSKNRLFKLSELVIKYINHLFNIPTFLWLHLVKKYIFMNHSECVLLASVE